jgi:hypothetical protein
MSLDTTVVFTIRKHSQKEVATRGICAIVTFWNLFRKKRKTRGRVSLEIYLLFLSEKIISDISKDKQAQPPHHIARAHIKSHIKVYDVILGASN